MDIGDFDRLVLVQQPGEGQDAAGQPVEAPVEVCRAWANIRHQSGAEAIRGGAPTSTVQASVRLWGYRTDLRADMRVLDITGLKLPEQLAQADRYEIRAVLPDKSGREWIDLVCEVVR